MVDRATAASSDPPLPPPPAPPEPDPQLRQPAAADGQQVASVGAAAGPPPPPPPQAGDADEEDAVASPAGQPGERCRAMMEVVAKDGKWKVTKLVVEHSHELQVAAGDVAATVPAVGMEFDSVDDAKGFYYGYGERVGFKARMGSNRRSVGKGEKILQRFLCWKGNSASKSKGKDSDAVKEAEEVVVVEGAAAAGKRKREPYKTRSRNPGKSTEVIEVEKGVGLGGAENGLELQNGKRSRRGRGKKTPVEHGEEPVVGFEVEKEVTEEASAEPDGDREEGEGEEGQEGLQEEVEVEVKEKRGRGRPKKAVMEDDALQARVLRELGVRASQYNNEERKKILNKYRSKRQSRPASSRPTKIASRQALAERRKRGDGGRFLSSEEQLPSQLPSERRSKRLEKQNLKMEKAESKEDETVEAEPDPEIEVVPGPGGEPKVGMVFLNEDKAYEFYVNYAETAGFSVRKGWLEKTAKNVAKSRSYVCSKEGFRPKSASIESKKSRPETRTGCQAHMTIKITASAKYVVTEFVDDHNHYLETPLADIQILKSQKLLAKVLQPPDPPKVVLIPNEYKNYTRTKCIKGMQLGDTQAICEYLHRMKGENPSFFYAIQVDEDDQFTNVFWADAKSIMDYNYFGDVLCVDTRYCTSTSDNGRPLLLFTGLNNHKQLIIFGSALIYDDSVQSFRWLFETFKSAMSGKQPKTVLTDQSAALSDAVSSSWPGTTHRFSLLHLYLNATKLFRDTFQGSETFASDFSRWLYEYEEDDFYSSWEILSEKHNIKDNEWLCKLYEDRERWALAYGRDTFCADIANTLRSDNTDTILTDLLKPEINLQNFFIKYDKFLEEKRLAEQQADYLGAQIAQRVAPLHLLWQAANSYTPTLFEMFRMEYEQISKCMVYSCGEIGPISEYQVTVNDRPRGQFVRFDSTECTVICSCKKFEFMGLLCCHVLKILDLRNIKELPPHYILKRWRKDAQSESAENYGFATIDEDPKFSLSKRYNTIYRNLYKIAAKASESVEAYAFLESQYEQLVGQVEVLLQAKLHDKSSLSTVLKGNQPNLPNSEVSSTEHRRATGKKIKNIEARRQQQSPLDPSKKKKGRQGLLEPEEIEIPLRVDPPTVSNDIQSHLRTPANQFLASSHMMQAPYVAQQFGLGSLQGFPGMSPFGQIQEPTHLQQPHLQPPPFHSGPQITQPPPPDIQSLQFLSSNPQLGHQTTDQGQYTIPVWDFL